MSPSISQYLQTQSDGMAHSRACRQRGCGFCGGSKGRSTPHVALASGGVVSGIGWAWQEWGQIDVCRQDKQKMHTS